MYKQQNTSKDVYIGFCIESREWNLYEADDKDEDPCDASIIVQSESTDFFDISTVFEENWFTKFKMPIDLQFFEKREDEDTFYCDFSLGDGKCDVDLNKAHYEWDYGDCCAATCDSPYCAKGGLHDAFGTTGVTGDGYSNCKEREMQNVTIHLTGFTDSRDAVDENSLNDWERAFMILYRDTYFREAELYDVPLSVYCNERLVLKVLINPDMVNQTETLRVKDGASCNIYIGNIASSQTVPKWYVNFTVYHEHRQNSMEILRGNSKDEEKFSFALVKDCHVNELLEKIDSETVYRFTHQSSKAMSLSMQKELQTYMCKDPSLITRYALLALNAAAPTASSDGRWVEERTEENTMYIQGLGLSGTIATEIGLLTNLQVMLISK